MAGAGISPISGLLNMARSTGSRIGPDTAKPFLDMEKDRQRMMMSRMLAGPAGGAAVHMAPVVPYEGKMQSVSQAVPQMAGMDINPPLGEGASAGAEVMNNLAPVLAMGTLGVGGSVLAGYLASKGVGKLMKGIRRRRALKKAGASPILDAGNDKQEQLMLKSIRLTKFAAAGALGTPGDVSGAVKTAAFSYGFLTEVVDQRVSSGNGMSPAEDSTLDELDDSIKTASEITSLIREQTGALSKMASELGNAVKIDKETLRKAASDGAVDPNAILSGGRSFEQIKEASTKLSAVGEVMRITDYGSMSKMGKSLDLLGVTPDIATYIANGTPAGLTTGVLGLLDAA